MNTSEEMRKGISSPEELKDCQKEEGEIKDEKTEVVTGGVGEGLTGRNPISAPERTPIA